MHESFVGRPARSAGRRCLRCNENQKSVPPRVEYVLEAQALKEAHDDPRWRRSSPEILLHDGVRNKREVIAIGGRKQRAVSTEALLFGSFAAKRWRSRSRPTVSGRRFAKWWNRK